MSSIHPFIHSSYIATSVQLMRLYLLCYINKWNQRTVYFCLIRCFLSAFEYLLRLILPKSYKTTKLQMSSIISEILQYIFLGFLFNEFVGLMFSF